MLNLRKAVWLPLLLIAGCAGSDAPANNGGGGGQQKVAVSMTNQDTFSPQVANASAGQTVEWTNNDADHHSVKPDVATPNMDSDPQFPPGLAPGEKFSFTVPANTPAGTKFFYHCRFHGGAGNGTALGPGMSGEILVQ